MGESCIRNWAPRKGEWFRRCWPTCICTTSWTCGLRRQCANRIEDRAGCSALRTTLWRVSSIGTSQSLSQYEYQVHGLLYKWLNRRSQKRSYTWKALNGMLERFNMPRPKIVETGRKQFIESCQLVWKFGPVLAPDLFGKHYRKARAGGELS